MPITFRQCQPEQLTAQDQIDIKKIFAETQSINVKASHVWVLADFNQRIVGAMLLSSLSGQDNQAMM